MRKIYTLLILVFAFTFSVNAQNLVITNVVDGSCGNTSKFVEIYVSGTVDLSNYKMVRRSNSGTWEDDGVDIALTDLGTKTDEFIYLIDDWNWMEVRKGTFDAIKDLKINVISSIDIKTTQDNKMPRFILGQYSDWHNGYFIAVCKKK